MPRSGSCTAIVATGRVHDSKVMNNLIREDDAAVDAPIPSLQRDKRGPPCSLTALRIVATMQRAQRDLRPFPATARESLEDVGRSIKRRHSLWNLPLKLSNDTFGQGLSGSI